MADAIERRVGELEEMVGDIPRLINIRFSHTRAQLEALDARMSTLEVKLDRLDHEVKQRLSTLEVKIDALPRILAEMLDERDRRKT